MGQDSYPNFMDEAKKGLSDCLKSFQKVAKGLEMEDEHLNNKYSALTGAYLLFCPYLKRQSMNDSIS